MKVEKKSTVKIKVKSEDADKLKAALAKINDKVVGFKPKNDFTDDEREVLKNLYEKL